ncbi:glycosyltransferase [Pengzhenrongella frigida]|uniref:Glycosyltransferase n=1 Tax=Pengzhenrongella frigida TaxID=1259133 RepID=A0A4V1ZHA6_9MICO|nr:glycosyltransferase [Cellulomonas sp. HLT2-17]RYV51374.1 glycosyltransferase [Cellulomonas sp. HLT2-17]
MSTSPTHARARATVRSAFACAPAVNVHVLDLDDSYVPVRDEQVVTPDDLGIAAHEHHVRSVLLDPAGQVRWMQPAILRHALESGPTAIAVGAGVVLLRDPAELADLAAEHQVALLSRAVETLPTDDRWPGPSDLLDAGSYAPGLIAVSRRATAFLSLWERLAADPSTSGDRWLDLAASTLPHLAVHSPGLLVSAWTCPASRIGTDAAGALSVDGTAAVAVDLTVLDPQAPWLLDPRSPRPPRVLLSEHPGLALLAAEHANELREDPVAIAQTDVTPMTSLGAAVHPQLRAVFRAALSESQDSCLEALPDPVDPNRSAEFAAWLVQPTPGGRDGGLGRYLASVYRSRPDLLAAYPGVPGEHVGPFLEWADLHGRHEPTYSTALIDLTLAAIRPEGATPRPHPRRGPARSGVNVVGYLRAELGVGESARLMVTALAAGGIPHATASVDAHLQSRQGARYAAAEVGAPFDTTLLCVNADMTPTIAASVPSLLTTSYRIGMWYWEVEDFPLSQHEGFRHVDEVWVATDFVRRAVEPHSPVPVRTITPPLPQPRAAPDRTRADLGLPDRPYFLFTFDYLSTAERKNPWGLVDAFEAAFRPGQGPLLVIKSINAAQRPDQAERLRLRVAGSTDVLLLEDYLSAEDRDALVALCTCYVSLHRSEGLGLTMAEAMAWGKPVIATGYSGNLQFMTEQNSFLVPWRPTAIGAGAEPYPADGIWADPDLDVAAQLMRQVIAEPDEAAARGARAVADLVALHSPQAAARHITARLAETSAQRRARSRLTLASQLRKTAQAARRTFR